jgi:hypothetical protein
MMVTVYMEKKKKKKGRERERIISETRMSRERRGKWIFLPKILLPRKIPN